MSTAGPGWYRLRAHARGRRYKEVTDEISEHYLIQVWPSEKREEIVYKATDPVGEINRKMIAGEL